MPSISEVGRGSQQINLRAPDGLHDRIKAEALKNGRSVNAELVHRLEASFEPSASLAPAISSLIEKHIEQQVAERLRAIASQLSNH